MFVFENPNTGHGGVAAFSRFGRRCAVKRDSCVHLEFLHISQDSLVVCVVANKESNLHAHYGESEMGVASEELTGVLAILHAHGLELPQHLVHALWRHVFDHLHSRTERVQ